MPARPKGANPSKKRGNNRRLMIKEVSRTPEGIYVYAQSGPKRKATACADYLLPEAVVTDANSHLNVGAGYLSAWPQREGVGSQFLKGVHEVFSEMSRRAGMPVKHTVSCTYPDSIDFFESGHNYAEIGPGKYQKTFSSSAPPRKLSAPRESLIRHLMGERLYHTTLPKK